MGTGLLTDVLLALVEVDGGDGAGAGGSLLQERLAAHRSRPPQSSALLGALLRLEQSGHVAVERGHELRFRLTAQGRSRAVELGGGQPVHLRLLMADLVGFVAYTSEHGDVAAHRAAQGLADTASAVVRRSGGSVVKGLGDGFLAWLPPSVDALPVMSAMVASWAGRERVPLAVRAASHVGHPIRHGGDLFGGDVNLVARLCEVAGPDELVVSRPDADPTSERVSLRGLAEPVAISRVALR